MDPALATTLAGLFLVLAGLFWMQFPRTPEQGYPVTAAFVVLFGAALLAVGLSAAKQRANDSPTRHPQDATATP